MSEAAATGIKGLHHNAYRCRDSEQPRKFYEDFLGLPLAVTLELGETKTGRQCAHLHTFYEMDDGSYLARGTGPEEMVVGGRGAEVMCKQNPNHPGVGDDGDGVAVDDALEGLFDGGNGTGADVSEGFAAGDRLGEWIGEKALIERVPGNFVVGHASPWADLKLRQSDVAGGLERVVRCNLLGGFHRSQ